MNNENHDIAPIAIDEQNLRALINNTDDPLWLVDVHHNVLECNEAFRTWVHHFTGRHISKGDNVLLNGEHKIYNDKFEMCYKLALSGSNFRTVEDMVINGVQHYTSVTFKPVIDSSGRVTAVSCFARDITEHRKHLFRIEQQNAALREIAFIESHRIRGPVATILGLEQLYNYTDLSDPMNKEIMDGIKKMGLDLDVIIRQVVKMSNEIGV
ncbi:hypothetical protein GCM10023093_22190 [Nemorincola caseinilytica]|uniref:PAC domain-containing protein n=1 Tax=Nemorincola caseinilytica TaxID=2054315 RepID=A0ABP8NKI3_9BACT